MTILRNAAGRRAARDLEHRSIVFIAAAPVLPAMTGVERWTHPPAGDLRLAYESLALSGVDEHRLVVYLPADDATAKALPGRAMSGLV